MRYATVDDAPALAALVNRAYAIEAFFVDGDRTDAGEIAAIIRGGERFVVLERAGGLAGAVLVAHAPGDASCGYFGMLSVDPELQGFGLGKRLVKIAEAICEADGCTTMSLKIINLREELARWYRSLGYRETATAPYLHRPVKRDCHFVEMRRSFTPLAVAA